MTTVEGRVIRPRLGYSSFVDITGPEVALTSITQAGLTFDGDLTVQQQADIHARMTSRDDTDQAARTNIATLRDAAVTGGVEDIRALGLATAAYLLGET